MNADRMTNAEYGAFLARDLPPMTDEEARAAALILASVGSEAPPTDPPTQTEPPTVSRRGRFRVWPPVRRIVRVSS